MHAERQEVATEPKDLPLSHENLFKMHALQQNRGAPFS